MDPENVVHRISPFISSLPSLSKDELDSSDCCPICLTPFEALLSDEPPSASRSEEYGVTKLSCGHVFCRKDLLEWIRTLHGSCPTCRDLFLDIHPPGSDDESSDGGEYVPDDDDDDEQDAFNTSDGFTDGDSEMDLDPDDIWERSDGEEMQLSADSEPSSEGDDRVEGLAVEVDISVAEDDSSDEMQAEEPK